MQRRLPFPASRAPEGQGRLDAIPHVELAVPYFPFRQTTPYTRFYRTQAGQVRDLIKAVSGGALRKLTPLLLHVRRLTYNFLRMEE